MEIRPEINFPQDMDPTIKAYLEGPFIDKKNGLTESKIKEIISKYEALDKETPQDTSELKLKAAELSSVQWNKLNVTPAESDDFQAKLGTASSPGEFGKYIFGDFKACANDDDTLFGGEIDGIRIYTTSSFRLLNGTLDNDQTSLSEWVFSRNDYIEGDSNFLKDAQKYIPVLAKMTASAINHLPLYEGLIYRGDALTKEELAEWRTGDKIMLTNKFLSCSTRADIGEQYAKMNAESYINERDIEYRPVVYAIQSENSRDITKYSLYPQEGERIYVPGQAFHAVKVDEEIVPGLAIIFLRELR